MFAEIPLHVIGQPESTGLLQRAKEEPFFAGLAQATRLPLRVTYQPLNTIGLKDTHQLQMLKEGQIFSLVAQRYSVDGTAQQGGSIGSVRRGQLPAAIEEASAGLD